MAEKEAKVICQKERPERLKAWRKDWALVAGIEGVERAQKLGKKGDLYRLRMTPGQVPVRKQGPLSIMTRNDSCQQPE